MPDTLIKEKISSLINISSHNIIVLKTIDSTNLYIKELSKNGATHETIVIADKQTNGRGRLGRDFFSPSGTGIYMSFLLKADKTPLNHSYITIAAGVAVCRVIKTITKATPSIKWVNDIFLNKKKVCGILAESTSNTINGTIDNIIVGIGLNISTPNEIFPGKLKDIAGSVFPENITRNEIVAKIIDEFRKIYTFNNIEALIDEYKSYSLILGKKISFTKYGKSFEGTAIDINNEGNLVVSLGNDETIILNSGEISLGSENFTD